jgi:hypothetical protein
LSRWNRPLLAFTIAIALAGTRPYAGSWNDGSRLATVESLVDDRSLAIDHSIFVVPAGPMSPYPAGSLASRCGTLDKLQIQGHYYSDKGPVPAVLMALLYGLLQLCTGLHARTAPHAFCFWMNALSSGLAYVVAVAGMDRLAQVVELAGMRRWLFTSSFALSTVALVYLQHVNNHILLLAAMSLITLNLVHLAKTSQHGETSGRRLGVLGLTAGFGYTFDLGLGPPLLLTLVGLVAWRTRRAASIVVFLMGSLPPIALHHAVNYWIGGTWGPANSVAAYFTWPGSPFNPSTMTGSLHHHSVRHALKYAWQMVFGARGFALHNLPIVLVGPALIGAWRRRDLYLPEITWACVCCGGGFWAYVLLSKNFSGVCLTIRWFVPFLAPAYLLIALHLKHVPHAAMDLGVLSAWGATMMALNWPAGPWVAGPIPGFWWLVGGALGSFLALQLGRGLGR